MGVGRNKKKSISAKRWYAASIIMSVRFKDGNQDKYPVWENVILIKASSDDEAIKKAEKEGREAEGDSRGTFTWDDRPAEWVFAGIRKLMAVENLNAGKDILTDGTEVTHSQFVLEDEDAFKRFINGKDVMVLYVTKTMSGREKKKCAAEND